MQSLEEFFLKYSFPCAGVLVQTGTITQENYDHIEAGIKNGEYPPRKEIEAYFPAAVRRLKKLSNEMGIKDYWNMDVMKEYWYNNHNKIIDERDGNYAKFPEVFCDFCKVHIAKIKEILPANFLLVEYEETRRPVSNEYVPNAKVGDKIRIHHAYAVEMAE